MQTDYAAFLHNNPSQPSAADIDLDRDDQADSVGDPNDDMKDDDDDDDLHDAPDEDEDEDDDGYALKETTTGVGGIIPNPPETSQFYPANVQLPFPLLGPSYIPQPPIPYFLTPPQHNPYSPTSGAGHLHPPVISRNPYQLAFPVPAPPVPPAEEVPPAAVPANPPAPLAPSVPPAAPFDPVDVNLVAEDPSSSEGPPTKRARKTNATIDLDAQNRSVDDLYVELPAPPPIFDPDPTAPPNSVPGRVIYQKFKCVVCNATFPRKNAVVAHIKTHVGKRRYACSHPGCKMAFVREHDCKRHESTHSGSRPHVCTCGRPFARPDALRRHREKGNCGPTEPATSPKDGEDASFNLDAVPPESDPTWTEGRPSGIDFPGVAAGGQPSVTFTPEEVISLTRQLDAATAAAAAVTTSDPVPTANAQFGADIATGSKSAVVEPTNSRNARSTATRKAAKKTGPGTRPRRATKSAAVLYDEDVSDAIDPSLASDVPPRDTNSVQASSASNIVHHTLGTLPYGSPAGGIPTGHPSQFLPYLHPLDPQGTPVPAHPTHPNPLSHVSFSPSTDNFSAGFAPGPGSYSYNPEGYRLRAADPSTQIPPLPADSANNTPGAGRGSFYQPPVASSSGSAFPRTAAGSNPSGGFSRGEPNSPNKAVGVSLVELAVDAATRAHQKRHEAQAAQFQAHATGQGINISGGGAHHRLGRIQPENGMDLDMSMDLLHSDEVRDRVPVQDDEDDIDGTDVGEPLVPHPITGSTKGKGKTKGAKNGGSSKRPSRTRSKVSDGA